MCFRYNWQTSRMPLLWHLSYFSRGRFCLLISTCSFLYPRWVKSRGRGEEGGGEDTVTCQLENLILSLRVSVRAFPGRCGATLGWTLTPQRAHHPTLLPPREPRGINARRNSFLVTPWSKRVNDGGGGGRRGEVLSSQVHLIKKDNYSASASMEHFAQIRYFKGQVATTESADEWQLPKALVKLSIFPVRRVQTHWFNFYLRTVLLQYSRAVLIVFSIFFLVTILLRQP